MRKLFATGLALAALGLSAAPALAGPIGSGLWLTESLARNPAREVTATVRIAAADAACLRDVAPQVASHTSVRKATVKRGQLAVQFDSHSAAAIERSAVHAIVAKACAGAQLASAS